MGTAVARSDNVTSSRRGGSRGRLGPVEKLSLIRALALGVATHQELSGQYDMTRQGITEFARRHKREIDDVRQNMDDPFAGILLARKENRLAAYVDEVRRLDEHPNADHHLWSTARQSAIHAIAEELGQLPPRMTVTVQPVQHIIEGVIVEDLR